MSTSVQYLRQKGPKVILEAWAPQYQKHDYAPEFRPPSLSPDCLYGSDWVLSNTYT